MNPVTNGGQYYDKHFYVPVDGGSEVTDVERVYVSEACNEAETDRGVKVGFTFRNYVLPAGQWGEIVTFDDLAYTGLAGIDLNMANGQDIIKEQFQEIIDWSIDELERYLGIVIRRRKIVTHPADTLTQERYWYDGVDYTHEDDPYDFDPTNWQNMGYLQLSYYPVIEVTRAVLKSTVQQDLIDLLEWLRLKKNSGQVQFYPKINGAQETYPFIGGEGLFLSRLNYNYPDAFQIDYEAGWKNSVLVPNDIRQLVFKFATINALSWVGDGLLAGFSSSSVSIDGMSESFSSTQSATSAYFGARIKQLQDEIKRSLQLVKRKYNNFPLGFA